jgi:hypothetical protein
MENIAYQLGLKALPGWLLIFVGLVDALHMMHFTVEHLGWLATPLGNLFVILFGFIWLGLVLYADKRKLRRPTTDDALASTIDTSRAQARQAAIKRLSELLTLGDAIVAQVPNSAATTSDFCRFWSDEIQRWSQQVEKLLNDNWGEQESRAFFSVTGVQYDLPVPRVHPEAVANYHQYSRWLQNLEQLKIGLQRP